MVFFVRIEAGEFMATNLDILKRIDELIENAEYHYFGKDEEQYMFGYLDGLKIAKSEIQKLITCDTK
jgi:hypothetical protein